MNEGGHLSARDSMNGTLREGSFTGEPEQWGFWEICKMPCKWASLSIGPLLGNLKGILLPGLLREKYIWVPFLVPGAIKILSLGAIWNFTKGTGLSWIDIRLRGTKGLSIRPRCIGTIGLKPTVNRSINQSINQSAPCWGTWTPSWQPRICRWLKML